MVAATRRQAATYADIEALPAHVVGEIVDGELHVSPRPASPHARAAARLFQMLGGAFDLGQTGPGGWLLLMEPELHLFGKKEPMIPDIAGWRRQAMPEMPVVPAFTTAPDWVCEVLSPSTARWDRTVKLPAYARVGVTHALLVDPVLETLEVFRREGTSWLVVAGFGGKEKVRAEPFDAIELDLGLVFAR